MVGFSESDMERIREFTELSRYGRSPDHLRPAEESDEPAASEAAD